MSVDISVIIVTYNNCDDISTCLESVARATKGFRVQLFIVDNASSDGTLEILQKSRANLHTDFFRIKIIQNHINVGFTSAANQGLVLGSGKFILLLNPDTVLKSDSVGTLIKILNSHPDVAVIAPQLLHPDGTVQPSCRRFPQRRDVLFEVAGLSRIFSRNRILNGWKMGDFDHTHTREVDQPQGACLLTRGSAMAEVGILDEQFIMFFSDVDWCARFIQNGWKILFCAEVPVIHTKGASIYRNRSRMIVHSHRDFMRYFRKHPRGRFQKFFDRLTEILLMSILVPRMLMSEFKGS